MATAARLISVKPKASEDCFYHLKTARRAIKANALEFISKALEGDIMTPCQSTDETYSKVRAIMAQSEKIENAMIALNDTMHRLSV